VPDRTQPQPAQPSPAPWPEGVIARYLTVGGVADPNATVDITDKGEDTYWRYDTACAGCPHADMFTDLDDARDDAQAHAERCRALPRPEVNP
jgi:TPP-dependent indolepyruvate ferredoxin oxidoreductase alpha subunit